MSKLFYKGLGKTETWPDITGIAPTSITYSDVTLVPQNSSITSRKEIDTSVQFGPYKLEVPITCSPMDSVSDETVIRALAKAGGIGTLPRGDMNELLKICERLSSDNIPCIYAVGLANAFIDAKKLKDRGAKVLLIDVAHGGLQGLKLAAKKVKEELGLTVVIGNIASYHQAKSYEEFGLEIAKVGVGPGSVCKTREVAGSGMPQLSAVMDVSSTGIFTIADGGLQTPGDVAKAIAAGASLVMSGSFFAGTTEAPKIRDENGNILYRGQASKEYMQDTGKALTKHRASEGVSARVKEKGSIAEVIEEISGGLKSAMSYANAKTIKEFQENAIFTLVSQSGYMEGKPHMLSRA